MIPADMAEMLGINVGQCPATEVNLKEKELVEKIFNDTNMHHGGIER